jgi:hypothetical protein
LAFSSGLGHKNARLAFKLDLNFTAQKIASESRIQKTGVPLWGFLEQINPAFFKKNRDTSFSATVQTLAGDIHTLLASGAPIPGPNQPSYKVLTF